MWGGKPHEYGRMEKVVFSLLSYERDAGSTRTSTTKNSNILLIPIDKRLLKVYSNT